MVANLSTARKRKCTASIVAFAALLSAATLPLVTKLSTPTSTSTAVGTVAPSQAVDFGKLPLSFEPNEGQTDPSVKYMTHASGGTMYFTRSEVVLALQSASKREPSSAKGSIGLASPASLSSSDSASDIQPVASSILRLQFIGANPDAVISSGEALPGKVNYFIGNDPSRWHTDVPTYAGTHYTGLYPGIDLKYDGTGGQLKGTYTVAPGADPSLVQWKYAGAQNVRIDEAGNMQVVLSGDGGSKSGLTVTEQAPIAWQELGGKRVTVNVRYNLASNGEVSFAVSGYDRSYPLVIDPPLTYSTFLGGSGDEDGYTIAVDSAGDAYVTGDTSSTNFPVQNAFQPTLNGVRNVFVTKFDATGSTLIYSTYLGGSGNSGEGEYSYGIAADAAGNAYVMGYTNSTDFPLQNAFQPTYGGGSRDAFVTEFDATGSTLIYSTYLGGSVDDYGYGIAVDSTGSAYVTGDTSSTNFPVQNAFQSTKHGGFDVFVTKFSPTGSSLTYSTYLGGGNNEVGYMIAVDTTGSAYLTGNTSSVNFPLQNPFQPTYGGDPIDGFVTKLSPTGSSLIYSTYLGGGGTGGDYGYGIAVDSTGSAYVMGGTTSGNFPVLNAFQPTYGGGSDAFVTKFSPTGSSLIYSTYLGGSSYDYGQGITVDTAGHAYVTGNTSSTDFPVLNAFQPTLMGGSDAFVTKLSPSGSSLAYSTYLGGSSYEWGWGVAVDATDNVYVTGNTSSTDFPVLNAFQATYGGGYYDAFVAKISGQEYTPTPSPIPPSPSSTDIPPTSTSEPPTDTPVPSTDTDTPVPSTATETMTDTPISPTSTDTPTACTIAFEDVPVGSTFYAYIQCLACRGIINGYPCGGPGEPCNPTNDPYFRLGNNVTRGQFAKITANAAGFNEPPGAQQYEDVPVGSTFFDYIWRLTDRGYINGYPCGGPGEPCGPGNLPYFRPNANVTRGQLSKIDANAAGFNEPPGAQQFEDVLPGSTFFDFIWRLTDLGVMNGYPCGGVGEPCGPNNLPYFRPSANATRGQASKIVSNTFSPNCQISTSP